MAQQLIVSPRSAWIVFAFGLLLVSLNLLPWPLTAQDQETVRALDGFQTNPFVGKYLELLLKSNSEYGVHLQDVEYRKIGTKEFLVGIGANTGWEEDYQKGKKIYVALDDVSQIVIFESEKEMRDALESEEEVVSLVK